MRTKKDDVRGRKSDEYGGNNSNDDGFKIILMLLQLR